jgi:septal ring factor EnvC (AmiA/AmiB activator)
LAQLADRQEETRSRLAASQTQRAALLEELEATISGGEGRVVTLKSEADGLRHLLDQLERRSRELPEAELVQEAIGKRRGQLGWPLPAVRLTERFGSPKGDGGQRWDGVLIAAPEGAEVHAVHPGRVVYANWLRGFGLLMIVEHEDGYMTLYGHNQTLLKESGEWVAAGDPIALSGMSGGLRSGGLYFAIRHRGKPLDPVKWCRAVQAADSAQRTDVRASMRREEPATISPLQLGAGGAPTKVLPRGAAACTTS